MESAPAGTTRRSVEPPKQSGPPKERHPAGEVLVESQETPELGQDDLRQKLGLPCSAGVADCGTLGRTAVARQHIGHVLGAWKPSFCAFEPVTPPIAPEMAKACAGGGLIAIETVCIMCRISSGERLVGAIAEMSPEQLAAAQKMAGLPASPALTTERAWTDAIAQAKKRRP